MSGIILNAFYLLPTTALKKLVLLLSHFTDKDAEIERSQVSYPRSHMS